MTKHSMIKFDRSFFEHEDGPKRAGDVAANMLSNEYPACIVRGGEGDFDHLFLAGLRLGGAMMAHIEGEPATHRIRTIEASLRNLNIRKRHLDCYSDEWYPRAKHLRGVTIRRHTAIHTPADVTMRHAQLGEAGSPSHRMRVIKPDKTQPTYHAEQYPGDSVYFVSKGGQLGEQFVLPAEHRFRNIGNRFVGRTIEIQKLVVAPQAKGRAVK